MIVTGKLVVSLQGISQLAVYQPFQKFHHSAGETNGSVVGDWCLFPFLKTGVMLADVQSLGRQP